MFKISIVKFLNGNYNSLFLVLLVSYLLWNSGIDFVSVLIVGYLFLVFLSRQEVYSTLFAGFFLLLFDFFWLTMRGEQVVDLKHYAILLFFGSVVLLLIYKIEELIFFRDKSVFGKILLGQNKLENLVLFLKSKIEHKDFSSLFFKKKLLELINYILFILKNVIQEINKRGFWFSVKMLCLLILFICLSLFTELVLFNVLIWVFLVYGILFCRDGRASASLAILFLLLTIYNLLKKQEIQAENMAIYAYYFLVISVIHSISTLKKAENEEKESCG